MTFDAFATDSSSTAKPALPTAPYSPAGSNFAPDFYFRNSTLGSSHRTPPRNEFRPSQLRKGRNTLPIVQWTLILRDFSGGMGVFAGPFDQYNNRYMAARKIDASVPGYLLNGQLVSSASSPVPTGNKMGVHYLNIFDTMIWGVGSGANVSLIKETSATDPTPTAITYTPTGSITGLFPAVIGGATAAQRMLVCRSGANAIQIVSTATGTVDATMDSSTNGAWGGLQTSLPGFPIIIYAGNTLLNSLTAASATGDAATGVISVPAGGTMLGEFALGQGTPLGWMLLPKSDVTAGALLAGSEKPMFLHHFNLEGTDLQKFNFKSFPNGIYQCVFVNNGWIATDKTRVSFHDGTNEQDLGLFDEQPHAVDATNLNYNISSNFRFECRGFATLGDTPLALCALIDTTSAVSTLMFWKRYDWDAKAWHYMGEATSNEAIMAGGNGHGVSNNTNFTQMYNATTAAWKRIQALPSGQNPYTQNRKTSGAGSSTGSQVEAAAEIWSVIWSLPGCEGYPSVIEEIRYNGDVWAGGSGASVEWRVARETDALTELSATMSFASAITAVFDATTRTGGQHKSFGDNKSAFYNLWLYGLLTRGSDSRMFPTGLPIVIRGLTFMDYVVRSPDEARALAG